MTEKFIVIDWGTTNFRAFLVDAISGQCLDRRSSNQGLLSLDRNQFSHYCESQVGEWRQQSNIPIYLSGMVGSALGWQESPQITVPIGISELAKNMVAVSDLSNAWIVPGIKELGDTHIDVMRGEEIQALGAMSLSLKSEVLCCLPGTHSKWVTINNRHIEHFITFMTGELFQVICRHTLPGRSADVSAPFDEQAFMLGLERVNDSGGILHALFEARSRQLYAGLSSEKIGSFISGALIGEEINAMKSARKPSESLYLIGEQGVCHSYRFALENAGFDVTYYSAEAATLAGVSLLVDLNQ